MTDIVEVEKKQEQRVIIHTYPLVRHSDMGEDMRDESIEIVVTACEKYSTDNEMAAKMIKENMDKKFNSPFHVVIGEAYGFEIGYQCRVIQKQRPLATEGHIIALIKKMISTRRNVVY
ncbi:hypothetical protein FQA39_LY02605 [Lamprigera yunnana]|nr:hypothetical protein FQA39_LY02605 [Lamprigera yunnana]